MMLQTMKVNHNNSSNNHQTPTLTHIEFQLLPVSQDETPAPVSQRIKNIKPISTKLNENFFKKNEKLSKKEAKLRDVKGQ